MERPENAFDPESLKTVKVIKRLTDDERYQTWHIQYKGKDTFLKHAVTDTTRSRLANEPWGAETMRHIAVYGSAPFRIPQVIAFDHTKGWFMSEWVDGTPLSGADYPKRDVLAAKDKVLEIYAFMDNLLVPNQKQSAALGKINSGEGMAKSIKEKLEAIPDTTKPIDQHLVDDAIAFIKANFQQLKPCFAHGDLTPKHVIKSSSGEHFVIDFESCSLHWPRFYELVNFTTKLTVVHEQKVIADELTKRFFAMIGETAINHEIELRVLAAIRTLLIVHELGWKRTSQRTYGVSLNDRHVNAVKQSLRQVLA